MPQELMRGLKGLGYTTSNGDYELAQRKAEETGLSHHCLFVFVFQTVLIMKMKINHIKS